MNTIDQRLERIEKLIASFAPAKDFLTIEEAALYLDYSVAYIYKLTHLGTLPFYRPNGKKIFFKRTELNEWIARHRSKPINQIQHENK
jgi:excisionase family DNA binding protein